MEVGADGAAMRMFTRIAAVDRDPSSPSSSDGRATSQREYEEFASSFNRELSDEEMNLDITWGKIGAILQSATRMI